MRVRAATLAAVYALVQLGAVLHFSMHDHVLSAGGQQVLGYSCDDHEHTHAHEHGHPHTHDVPRDDARPADGVWSRSAEHECQTEACWTFEHLTQSLSDDACDGGFALAGLVALRVVLAPETAEPAAGVRYAFAPKTSPPQG